MSELKFSYNVQNASCGKTMTLNTPGKEQIFHGEKPPFSLTQGQYFYLHLSLARWHQLTQEKLANNPTLSLSLPTWPGCQKS